MYVFSSRSLKAMEGVHPLLVKVVALALKKSEIDFTVVEGLRTLDKQKEYFAKGASKTLKSKHLKQLDGFGHAVDLYPYYDGKVQVDASKGRFDFIAVAMKQAAKEIGVKITWGGDWKTFPDCPHFQIDL